jgi:NAD-dependent SIR2 family protein deacetylase
MASTVDSKRIQEYSESSEFMFEAKLDKLADMIRESNYTVFYTGAGMSTAAGVGDYRGPSGAWTQRRIKELQKLRSALGPKDAEELQKLLAEQKKEQTKAATKVPMTDAQPTLSHMMQATLIRSGLAHFVVTTNLDGIYRKAGLQAHEDVCFLHGDVYTERCTACGYDFERNWHVRQSETHVHDHSIGTCSRCGCAPPKGYTGKPKAGSRTGADGDGFAENRLIGTRDENVGTKDTHINFGECLDEVDWQEAEQHCSKADLCIVMGTSMSLRHITHFPFQARRTVIINLQQTPDDRKCDLRIWAQCDPVSAGLLARLGLEPLPIPIWRPRDALPLDQIPAHVSSSYREAAKRLSDLAAQQEQRNKKSEVEQTLTSHNTSHSPEARVVVGNAHQELQDGRHEWRLYVAGNGTDQLSSVEVWLHPTFKKNHYTLEAAPFELQCTGWGTFDVPMRLHKKNGEHRDLTWSLQFEHDDAHTLIEL